jgi:hypothetical protein
MNVGDQADSPPVVIPTVPETDFIICNPNDPYDTPDEHAEANDYIFTKLFFWSGPGGTFSTWRERHIFLRAFRNGFGTALFAKFTECPAMWNDEGQYYEAGQEFGYVFKVGFQISAAWVAGQLGVLAALGGIDIGGTIDLNINNVQNLLESIKMLF